MSDVAGASWEDAVRWLRDDPAQRQLVLDAYYDDPLEAAARRYHASTEWQEIRRHLPRGGGDALDVGAGRGIASFALAQEGFAVTALEPDPSDLVGQGAIRALAAQCRMPITVAGTVSERLPFADARFDLIFARAVLHHMSDLPAAMREFYRVLKPGGRLIALREHVISRAEDLPAFLAAHPLHHRYGGENAFRLPVYLDAISRAGLTIEQVLAPLQSVINYAPHDRRSLAREIAGRLRLRPAAALARSILSLPLVGDLALRLARQVDHRPGRHYSFVATRAR